MTKDEKALEEHVAAELALFEEQGKTFVCRGAQEQNVAAVMQRIERNVAVSARAAAAAADDDARELHLEKAKDAEHLAGLFAAAVEALQEGQAGGLFRELAPRELGPLPLDGEAGHVRTGRVVRMLVLLGDRKSAQLVDSIARRRCGADLRETIAALPRPCSNATYTCPKCGREGHASKVPVAA